MSSNSTTTQLAVIDISTTNYVTTSYKDDADDGLLSTGMLISIVYGCSHLLLLLILAIHIYVSSRKQGQSLSIKRFMLNLWKERGIYTPLLIHIYDTATDVGVLYEWYILAEIERNGRNLESLDMNQFFWCGMGFMFTYRGLLALGGFAAAAIAIGDMDPSKKLYIGPCRWILQLITIILAGLVGGIIGALELTVFVGIFLDFKSKQSGDQEDKGAGMYQKACQSTEGILESLPEVIMQSVFVMRAINDKRLDKAAGDIFVLVIFSIFASILSITSKYVWVDEFMVYEFAASVVMHEDDTASLEKEEQHFMMKCCWYPKYYLSWGYVIRVVWRLAAVIARFVIFALIWVTMGGAFEIVLVPMMVLVWYTSVLCYAFRGNCNAAKIAIKKMWKELYEVYPFGHSWMSDQFFAILACLAFVAAGSLIGILGVVFQLGIAVLSGKVIYIIRMIENFALMIAISVFAFMKFECKYCASYQYRDATKNYRILLWIVIGWLAVLIHTTMSYLMIKIIDKEYDVDAGTVIEKAFADYQKKYHEFLYNQFMKNDQKHFSVPNCPECGEEMLVNNFGLANVKSHMGERHCYLGDHKAYDKIWTCYRTENHESEVHVCMPCGMNWKRTVNVERGNDKTTNVQIQTQKQVELTTKNEE